MQEEHVTLWGGPMDGYRVPVTGWTPEQRATGVAHMSENGAYGPGGRCCYGPPEGDPMAEIWEWEATAPERE